MSKNTQNTNQGLLQSAKRNQITAKESGRSAQKLRSTSECTSQLLQSINFPGCRGPLKETFAKQCGKAKKRKNSLQKRRAASVGRATVPITPQMIRVAVKELQTRRVYISSSLIASHLRRFYPIKNDPVALKKELSEKLDCAVFVGLIAKCGDDKYCIPTLRQQASLDKTALTAFWDTYYKSGAPSTMGQLFTSGITKVRPYKKKTSVAPKGSYGSETDNYQDLDEFES